MNAPHLRARGHKEELARLADELQLIAARARTILGEQDDDGKKRTPRPSGPLDRAGVARALLDERGLITGFFDQALFADPARDLMLELYIAMQTGKRLSISAACIASGVPPTTALRWINRLVDDGILVRDADARDGRRVFVALSADAFLGVDRYLALAATSLSQAFGPVSLPG